MMAESRSDVTFSLYYATSSVDSRAKIDSQLLDRDSKYLHQAGGGGERCTVLHLSQAFSTQHVLRERPYRYPCPASPYFQPRTSDTSLSSAIRRLH